jgi:hypothetical protein
MAKQKAEINNEKIEPSIRIKDLFNLKESVSVEADKIFKKNILSRDISKQDIEDLVDIILEQEKIIVNSQRKINFIKY